MTSKVEQLGRSGVLDWRGSSVVDMNMCLVSFDISRFLIESRASITPRHHYLDFRSNGLHSAEWCHIKIIENFPNTIYSVSIRPGSFYHGRDDLRHIVRPTMLVMEGGLGQEITGTMIWMCILHAKHFAEVTKGRRQFYDKRLPKPSHHLSP